MPGCDLVLRDVTFPDGRNADIGFKSGRIVHIGAVEKADETVGCHGMLLIPAATDMHVHMRGGTQAEKEDWQSGTMSAIAGGVTLVVDQPNTVPALTSSSRYTNRVKEAISGACCGFAINAGVAPGADLPSLWAAGAMAFGELFAGPSSYGEALSSDELSGALTVIHQMNSLATIHAEEVGTMQPKTLLSHDFNRNYQGEADAVRKVFEVNTSGCPLHFCHMSSTAAIDAVLENRGPPTVFREGFNEIPRPCMTSFEVTPHHLLLSSQDFLHDDTRAKVNPPLRNKKIQESLWGMWDHIDVIASDHAPHTAIEKAVDFSNAPSGIPGVETMVPLLLAEVQQRKIPVRSLIEKVSRRPASVLGVPPAGFSPGERVDFALYSRDISVVDPQELHSRARWTPFAGRPAIFPELVIMGGRIIYRDGEFFSPVGRWYPGKGYQVAG